MAKAKKATTKQSAPTTSELVAALQALMSASGHMSPFGNCPSVKSVRLAGKYMAAFDAAQALVKRAKASAQ